MGPDQPGAFGSFFSSVGAAGAAIPLLGSAGAASDLAASGAGAGAGAGAGIAAGAGAAVFGAGAGAGFSPQAVSPSARTAASRNERFMIYPFRIIVSIDLTDFGQPVRPRRILILGVFQRNRQCPLESKRRRSDGWR